MKTIYSLCLAVLLFSCSDGAENTKSISIEFDDNSIIQTCDTDFLAFEGEHRIKTAELSAASSRYWDFVGPEKGFDVPTLAVFDLNAKQINYYNVETGENYKTINLDFNGKDKIYFANFPYSSFNVLSKDELLLFDGQNALATLLDGEGSFKGRLRSSDPSVNISISAVSSIVKHNDAYISFARPLMDSVSFDSYDGKGKYLALLDLEERSAKFIESSLPEPYTSTIFGISAHNYQLFQGLKGEVMASFPASPLLHQLDMSNYQWKPFGQVLDVLNAVKPLAPNERNNSSSYDSNKFYLLNDLYEELYVDNVNDYYLRIGKRKIAEENYIPNTWPEVQYTLSFQDQNGNVTCNCEMNSSGGFYVFSEGYIYISQSTGNLTSDDEMVFHKYKYLN
ncbi:DUF4221 family protein [Penaeicola halotolerans]|uniref:DUF4221 family protein n=1 Tax=Penaeicola halotolerans TaxID=2793196 RepID=UPI001CF81BAB|nr:DUF4221 family protein [Penaeicola halotolerans]